MATIVDVKDPTFLVGTRHNYIFLITKKYIEMRDKDYQPIQIIACKQCIKDLQSAIDLFKDLQVKKK
jgi:hypothetical protein